MDNGGKCGVCGDAYDGPRDHEADGLFPRSPIVKQYTAGHVISEFVGQ